MEVKYTKKDEYGSMTRKYNLVGLEFQDEIPYVHPFTAEICFIPPMDRWVSMLVEGIDVYGGQGTEYDWSYYKLYVILHEIEPGVVIPCYVGLSDCVTRRTRIHTHTPDPSTIAKGIYFADLYGIKVIDVLLFDIEKHPKLKVKGGKKYRARTAEAIEMELIRNLSCKYDLLNTSHNIPHRKKKPDSSEIKLLAENSEIRRKNMSHGTSVRELHAIACSKKVEELKEEPISLMRFVA